jgi:hypothetical protein
MISQLYFTYSCTILSVNDDLTLNVELEDTYNKKSRTVTITLAGLTFDDFSSAEKQKTKDAILLLTMGADSPRVPAWTTTHSIPTHCITLN